MAFDSNPILPDFPQLLLEIESTGQHGLPCDYSVTP